MYANSYNAKVIGNYKGIIKYNSGTTCVANIPSLIFNATWSIDLTNNDIGYIVDKQSNLPYTININNKKTFRTTQEIMQSISNTGAVTYECGINESNWVAKKNILETSLWYDENKIGQTIFWDKYKLIEEPIQWNVTPIYECNSLIWSANPDQWGDDYWYPDFDLCTNTIVLTWLTNIPISSSLTNNLWARDIYAFVLEQGKNYTLEALWDDEASDTAFFLFDNQWNKLIINDDMDTGIYRSSIDFTPNYTGYYFLWVMGYWDEGTYADYTLDISEWSWIKIINWSCWSDAGKSLVLAPVNLCNKWKPFRSDCSVLKFIWPSYHSLSLNSV